MRHSSVAAKVPVVTYAEIHTSFGTVKVKLLTKDAPKTVANFERLVRKHFYGKRMFFNRDVKNFVIQTGVFHLTNTNQIKEYPNRPSLPNEAGVSNTRGTLAMAKSSGSGSRSSGNIWFFNLKSNRELNSEDGGFTVFGKITSKAGLHVLSKLGHAKVINKSSMSPAFRYLPVKDYHGTLEPKNFVYVSKITIVKK
jgi:cyclophilin family peptidyl-prolyl cis-trans isomerase